MYSKIADILWPNNTIISANVQKEVYKSLCATAPFTQQKTRHSTNAHKCRAGWLNYS